MSDRLLLANSRIVCLALTKYVFVLLLVTIPLIGQATPSGFGTFTLNSQAGTGNLASGSYITKNGDEGTFTIKRKAASVGYDGEKFKGGAEGIEIENDLKQGTVNDAKDQFSYTFTIAPTNPNTIHTIKIGQATYDKIGNSEIARQTLSYTDFTPLRLGTTASATIRENPSVAYFYDAMGDYFMGKKLNETNLQANIAKSEPQLRINDSASNPLYYYNITNLNGTGNTASYTPTRTDDTLKEVTLRTANGILPNPATFANILKSSAQPNTYRALRQGDVLGNDSTYVSYGILNKDSNYVIDVRNAQSVTLKYEGIMNGNFAVNASVVGETFKEWITFGVESEPAPNVIPAPPNTPPNDNIVQCDAGYIYDAFASSDYDNLATTSGLKVPSVGSNKSIVGNKNESYVLVSNTLSSNETAVSGVSNSYQRATTAGVPVFGFLQNFAAKSGNSTVSYKFINKFTTQAQALSKVSLSIFDIDNNYLGPNNFGFFDAVTIKGFTNLEGTGTAIIPKLTYGPKMTSSPPYRQNITTSGTVCDNNILDSNCQVSVTFDRNEVVRVDVTYGNNTAITSYNGSNGNPSDQYIGIRMDGYCYKPQPRITYSKELADPRKIDTDQFVVQIKDNASSVVTGGISSTTTAGEGNIVSDGTGTTGIFKVDPTKTYTLTEGVAGTTNLFSYKPSYECKKSDSTVVTNLNPNSLKLTYGDDWRCIITNSALNYVISGIVFNDKGKVTDPSSDDVSAKYVSDSEYFNGKFNPLVESSIPYTAGHTITLSQCSGGDTFTSQTVNINADGTYSFILTPSQISNNTKLCITQNEPPNYLYSVDTTSNTQQIDIVDNKYTYSGNDFGDVIQDNAALVLIKSQYAHSCTLTDLMSINVNYEDSLNKNFSKKPLKDVIPGQCIAYRIEAVNRGNVTLTDIIISDPLQVKDIKNGILVTSTLTNPIPISENTGNPTFSNDSVAINNNGKVITNGFSLNPQNRSAIRFNTKYGTTVDP